MREVKFRAWDKDDCVMKSSRTMREIMLSTPMSNQVVDSYIFEQFTGLEDSNGVDIYEGDILTDTDDVDLTPYEVVWCDQSAQWRTHCNESDTCSVFEMSEALVEYAPYDKIIGNIHENPELLETP